MSEHKLPDDCILLFSVDVVVITEHLSRFEACLAQPIADVLRTGVADGFRNDDHDSQRALISQEVETRPQNPVANSSVTIGLFHPELADHPSVGVSLLHRGEADRPLAQHGDCRRTLRNDRPPLRRHPCPRKTFQIDIRHGRQVFVPRQAELQPIDNRHE